MKQGLTKSREEGKAEKERKKNKEREKGGLCYIMPCKFDYYNVTYTRAGRHADKNDKYTVEKSRKKFMLKRDGSILVLENGMM